MLYEHTIERFKSTNLLFKKNYCRIIDEKGIDELKRRILLNLDDLYKMLVWNEENGIEFFA